MIREKLGRLRQDREEPTGKSRAAITFFLYKPVSIVVHLVVPVSTFFLSGVHVRSNVSLCWLVRMCLSSFVLCRAGMADQRPDRPSGLGWTSHQRPVCLQGFVCTVLSTTKTMPGPPHLWGTWILLFPSVLTESFIAGQHALCPSASWLLTATQA